MRENNDTGSGWSDTLVFIDTSGPGRADSLIEILETAAGLERIEDPDALEQALRDAPQPRRLLIITQPDPDFARSLNPGTTQVRLLEQALATAKAQASAFEQEISALKGRHAKEIRAQTALAQQSLSTLNARSLALERLKAEVETLRQETRSKDDEISLLTLRLAKTDTALGGNGAGKDADNGKAGAARRSLSRRLGAPLRKMAAVLRGR